MIFNALHNSEAAIHLAQGLATHNTVLINMQNTKQWESTIYLPIYSSKQNG